MLLMSSFKSIFLFLFFSFLNSANFIAYDFNCNSYSFISAKPLNFSSSPKMLNKNAFGKSEKEIFKSNFV